MLLSHGLMGSLRRQRIRTGSSNARTQWLHRQRIRTASRLCVCVTRVCRLAAKTAMGSGGIDDFGVDCLVPGVTGVVGRVVRKAAR